MVTQAIMGMAKALSSDFARIEREMQGNSDGPTPGPWTLHACAGGYQIIKSDDFNVRIVRGAGGVKRREDALLIAAAPDLLAACRLALEQLATDGRYQLLRDHLRVVVENA